MEPLYTLENKDCLEQIKTIANNSIDLILTDPPYLISKKTGFLDSKGENTIDRFKMSYDFGKWDKESLDLNAIVSQFYRILKPGGTCVVFYDIWKLQELKEEYEKNKFKQIRFIEWVKTNPVPINSKINYLTNAREVALTAIKKSKPVFNSSYDNGIYSFPIYHSKDRFHPTQKSLDLFVELVKKHSNKGDTVYDPFAGSATTGVACIRTGRSFIGVEKDDVYFKKARERLLKEEKNISSQELDKQNDLC